MEIAGIIIISVLIGAVLGFGAAWALGIFNARSAQDIADAVFQENEARIKDIFGNLSLEALSKSTEEFLKLAKQKLDAEREMSSKELDSKKGLIDQQLSRMTTELEKVNTLVTSLEKDREHKFGELTKHLEMAGRQTNELIQTTGTLREALASSKARGQWGERMAEDVLRVAGFQEDINYLKQKAIEGGRSIPDYTFFLPRDLRLNMDVKFPFDNYIKYLEADNGADKDRYLQNFMSDVRRRIGEVANRDYIDPGQNTVDYVLLFIPNEQIYSFINEQDGTLMDEGIRKKVILCSPLTLFAVLAVIRQAVDNFTLERTSNEIISLFGGFKRQWLMFLEELNRLGKKIEDSQKVYETLVTTRRRQLERPLNRIEEIRLERELPSIEPSSGELEE